MDVRLHHHLWSVAVGTVVAALAIVVAPGRASAQAPPAPVNTLLDFHEMAPVTSPFIGTANPIRGVAGGALPWAITHADGTLRSDGALEVNVFGLVLANDPAVPPNQQNTNPSPAFVAIVSCQSVEGGAPKEVNVTTPQAPASPTGDARIQATVQLPTPCLAPVIFVAGTNGAWFAMTGR
ncbi:hypothetical protein [Anaeromyxobacter oryzae]|uniref:Uncharacterized protein n=1 Tax=Anaeromyxobacter oryzae TaxID=2918170 RepID=A0ABM7WPQ4_9BACT|nr:hypothetical protein [Anaeromyxobacter oryzae]BDG01451.1 hypothetical protein AMOR_04470 [Anaeromyxobacter oryzae]